MADSGGKTYTANPASSTGATATMLKTVRKVLCLAGGVS
jgi:hypothetical protein